MDRKERIKTLMIENNRKLLYQKMQVYVNDITLDSFISLNETKKLQEDVFSIMSDMDEKKECLIIPLDISYYEILDSNKENWRIKTENNIVFFHRDALDIGAIELNIRTVFDNIKYIVSESEMGDYGCRILLVSRDLKYGMCLWRGEHDMKLYKWEDR